MNLFFPFAISFALFYSCKKESPIVINFTTITETDANGNLVGTIDPNSWTNDSIWSATELALLYFVNPADTITNTLVGPVTVAPAYPNPSGGIFNLRVTTSQTCVMKVAIVNDDFETLYYNSRVMYGGPFILQYDVSGLTAFHKNNYYRLYYGFFNAYDSLYYKGHGNLYIE